MIAAHRILAYLVCVLVCLQAASHAWASAGIGKYVQDGGVIDKAAMEKGGADFPEVAGFIVHGMNGMILIPLVALALLVVAFLAKFPGAVRGAAIVLVLVVLQVTLGLLGHGATALAFLHGLNALLIFGFALHAAQRTPQPAPPRSSGGVRRSTPPREPLPRPPRARGRPDWQQCWWWSPPARGSPGAAGCPRRTTPWAWGTWTSAGARPSSTTTGTGRRSPTSETVRRRLMCPSS